MSEGKTIRINKVLKDLNISLATAVKELKKPLKRISSLFKSFLLLIFIFFPPF